MAYQIDYSTVYQLMAYIQHVIDGFHCKRPESTSKVFKYMSATLERNCCSSYAVLELEQ